MPRGNQTHVSQKIKLKTINAGHLTIRTDTDLLYADIIRTIHGCLLVINFFNSQVLIPTLLLTGI